jgi:hypothetical protein
MIRIFLFSLIFISLFSCSDFAVSKTGTVGNKCFENGTCLNNLTCQNEICVDLSADNKCTKGDIQWVTCPTDLEKVLKQTCNSNGEWISSNECETCHEGMERDAVCESDVSKLQKQICDSEGHWIDKDECFDPKADEENDEDAIDTGDTGNTGDTGDTGNTGNSGNTGNTGDSGNSGDTGDTGDTGDNFPNEHDGLDWSDASSSVMDWNTAIIYCENLGGRLPTISELRTLIQNCPATETSGECGVTDDCLSYAACRNDSCSGCEYNSEGKYSVFGDIYWFWSSSEQSVDTDHVWYVGFYHGDVGSNTESNKSDYLHVRCVR